MARQNTRAAKVRATTPLATATRPDTRTFEGAPAFTKTTLTDLFSLATTDFGGESTFYEDGDTRRARYRQLIHTVTATDPAWLTDMLPWLRNAANMRANPLIGAIEFGRALDTLDCQVPDTITPHVDRVRYITNDGRLACVAHRGTLFRSLRPRSILDETLRRADEPGEALAYWTSNYGRTMPKWFKRGVADAAMRLWTERSALKYDSPAVAWRMADVMELCHPGDRNAGTQRLRPFQGGGEKGAGLFPWLLADRHNRDDAKTPPESLPMLRARAELMALPVAERRNALKDPQRLADAGMTWESLAGWLQGPMDAEAWTSVIPSMGIMALSRNLRNFDQAGVSDTVAAQVSAKLMDAEVIAGSRMFPFRFLSAYEAVPSDRWRHPIGVALTHSTQNVPVLPGRTLCVIDVSGSMRHVLSAKSTVQRWKIAALFAAVTAHRSGVGNVDVVAYGTNSVGVQMTAGGSVLRDIETLAGVMEINERNGWGNRTGLGHGTNTRAAVANHYRGHDRVIVFTDAQSMDGDPGEAIPATTPLYTFDLAGYAPASTAVDTNRHMVSGFTDQAFTMMQRVERSRDSGWPWEQK